MELILVHVKLDSQNKIILDNNSEKGAVPCLNRLLVECYWLRVC